MTTFSSALFVINETYSDEYVKQHMTPLKVTQALADAGLLAPALTSPASNGPATRSPHQRLPCLTAGDSLNTRNTGAFWWSELTGKTRSTPPPTRRPAYAPTYRWWAI